jgi:hypothetical protein
MTFNTSVHARKMIRRDCLASHLAALPVAMKVSLSDLTGACRCACVVRCC